MNIEVISSAQNPKIKSLRSLYESSKERKSKGVFVLEGKREIDAASAKGFSIETLYYCPDMTSFESAKQYRATQYFALTSELYSRVAYRGTTEGIIAIVKAPENSLDSIKLSKNPLIIVLESVEKPGNLGAVLRTADAVKADAVIICDPLTDIYNPNVIRSSLGGIFTNQVAVCDSKEAYSWIKKHEISIFTAELQASEWYHKCDFTISTALVMGAEADGLSDFWRERADQRIKIPMLGQLDSLNVSVSTAVLCFEALRQRNFYFQI